MRLSRYSRSLRAMPPVLVIACVLLSACSSPKPPEEQRRPEPQAQPKSTLVQAANGYKEAAHASVTASEDAAKREKAALDAATQ